MRIRKRELNERGSSLVELLVSAGLFAVMGLAVANSSLLASNSRGRAHNHSIAAQLAIEEIERLAAIDPTLLNGGDNKTESINREGREFQRQLTIAVNTDGSRTVQVRVNNTVSKLKGEVVLAEVFPLWGSK